MYYQRVIGGDLKGDRRYRLQWKEGEMERVGDAPEVKEQFK